MLFDAKKGGLIVQIVGFKVGNQSGGYLMDIMKRDSDATPAPIQVLKSSCVGSSGVASFLKITDARSWAPAGHGIVRLAGFSTQLSVLFLGSAVDKRFPVDLKVIGKPGCFLWTLPEVLVPVKMRLIRRTFAETVVLSLPNNPVLAGARFRMQAFELDARAPVAGIRVSSGLDVRLGKQGTRSFVARTIHRLSPSDPEIIESAEGAPILRISY